MNITPINAYTTLSFKQNNTNNNTLQKTQTRYYDPKEGYGVDSTQFQRNIDKTDNITTKLTKTLKNIFTPPVKPESAKKPDVTYYDVVYDRLYKY